MSKRGLYKPAPSQTPPRVSRKSLTQGRLVSTDPRTSLLDNISPGVQKVSSPSSQRSTTPRARRSLDYHSFTSSTTSDQHPPPFKITPTIVGSPAKVKPSSSLSLSDTEGESKNHLSNNQVKKSITTIISSQAQPTVLTIDASQRHSSFKDSEVPITTSYVKSPVKVVCHSPMKNISRNEHAGKVTIPAVETKSNETQSSTPPASEASLSTVAGSPVDRDSKAIKTIVAQERNNPRSYISFLDDDKPISLTDTIDEPTMSVQQLKFDDTVISSIAGDTTINNFHDDSRPATKKKRKPKVVQSRYQKSSTAKKADSRSRVTTANKAEENKLKKTRTKASSRPALKDKEKSTEVSRKEKMTQPQLTSTPSEVVHPAIVTGGYVPVVTPLAMDQITGTLKSDIHKETNKDISHKKETKTEHPNSQLQLDLTHARFCQWHFLHSKNKHTLEKQEKTAQEQIYSVWAMNEELRKENQKKRLEIETKRKMDEVDQQLETQLSCLKSFDRNLNPLRSGYNSLVEGIDTTRHHMVIKNILLPDNEADLLAGLDSCENILGEIISLLQEQDDQAKVLSFSNDMGVLSDTLQKEMEEHDRCIELLAAASTLTTQQQSLQAQLIQEKEPEDYL